MKLEEFKKLTADEKLAYIVSFVENHTRCTGQFGQTYLFTIEDEDTDTEVTFDLVGTPECEWAIHIGDNYSYTIKGYNATLITAQFRHACIPTFIDEQEFLDILHWKPTL